MLLSVYKHSPKLFRFSPNNIKNQINLTQTINASKLGGIAFSFGSKKKRVVQLNPSRIDFTSVSNQPQQQPQINAKQSYIQLRHKIDSLPWQEMSFDKLCALDQQLIDTLETELKKDKFNISDEQFLKSQLKNGQQIPLATYNDLDRHYKKVFTLLKGTNDYYEQFPPIEEVKKGYLHQIYLTDLINDKELNLTISRFVKHIAKPEKLEALCEPTFVKYLLSLRRELLLQGIHFETKAEKREAIQKRQRVIESNQKQQLPKIKILQVLNYQYEFWQDVKHNRAKNGSEENFQIETKQVPNPNQSILLRDLYPTVKIKYIARHKSLKNGEKCFCLKADLLIEVDEKMKRKIKIEWKGPTNAKLNDVKPKIKKSIPENQEEEQDSPRVNYMIIDYENIYDGNPTIRPIFYF